MNLTRKRFLIAILGLLFATSLVFVQWIEVVRRRTEAGLERAPIAVPAASAECVSCHGESTPGIIEQWNHSTHAEKGVGCTECHAAKEEDADAFAHFGATIATIVTPRDCGLCHPHEAEEFQRSRHAAGGEILDSLDNVLAEVVEGHRGPIQPFEGRGRPLAGQAVARLGCLQCHGSKVALLDQDGGTVTVDDLAPDADGRPTNAEAVARIARDGSGRPRFYAGSWPNTGIGRLNLDGSRGSCSACHSRHDFSPRRARQPENCGRCHLGPDHPQKEIYEESKHGIAYRDLIASMNLDGETWVLGRDYSAAPTCATCHMSGHLRNGGQVTHDPGERISWTNRPAISAPTEDSMKKRSQMQLVCTHCHTGGYVNGFYEQYDEFVGVYNEKFARPGQAVITVLLEQGLITADPFDDEIEFVWFELWHHAGRRARHGASMMAPDFAQWEGMYEVAELFYVELLPQARELAEAAKARGEEDKAVAVIARLDEILSRPEHAWQGEAKPE